MKSRPWSVDGSTPLHCEILARAASHADVQQRADETAHEAQGAAGVTTFTRVS